MGAQVLTIGPLNALLWIAGVIALLRAKSISRARWLGVTYLVFYAIMYALHAKDYYLAGIYPVLFAAGAIAWEHRFAASRSVSEHRVYAFPIFQTILLVGTIVILPMASFYADRFIWNEQVAAVLGAWHSLTPEEQARVCIFGKDYGNAGALDFLGHMQEPRLSPALSGHNNYWMWGMHGCDPNLVIAIIPDRPEAVGRKYETVQPIPFADNPWAMPFERHRHIYLLRNRRPGAPFDWEDERFYY